MAASSGFAHPSDSIERRAYIRAAGRGRSNGHPKMGCCWNNWNLRFEQARFCPVGLLLRRAIGSGLASRGGTVFNNTLEVGRRCDDYQFPKLLRIPAVL